MHTKVAFVHKCALFFHIIWRNEDFIRPLHPEKRKEYSKHIILTITIMSEIEKKVQDIIVDKLGVDAAEVSAEKSFTGDLGADSLDTVELIMEFEKEFGITIPDDEAEKIATVGDAIAYIEAHQ